MLRDLVFALLIVTLAAIVAAGVAVGVVAMAGAN